MPEDKLGWVTEVSELAGDFATLRGYAVDDLARHVSFTAAAYLAFTGELPTPAQEQMFDRMLVLTVAHGVAPSGVVARSMIACGSPIQAALAVGALTVGDVHGGAGEQTARLLQETIVPMADREGADVAARQAVDDALADGGRVPGFGHQHHHDGDPRSNFIMDSAGELGVAGTACSLVRRMEAALAERKGRVIRLNADGAISAVLTDLSIDWRFSRPFMIVGRAPVLGALSVEELQHHSRNWRDLMVVGENYRGPEPRPVRQPYFDS